VIAEPCRSSATASVAREIRCGETSLPWISARCDWMSRTLMPRVHAQNLAVESLNERSCSFASLGSNVPLR